MIAFLGMYDMPAIRPVNDRFWDSIRAHLGKGPARLTRDMDPWLIWRSPDLLLAQACGMPYRLRLHDAVSLVATPDYGLAGCPPGYYHSVLISHADASGDRPQDFAGRRFAYNEALSQSGWAAPITHLNGLGVAFDTHIRTGAHAASARAVAEGHADIAGIDAVTWALLCEHDPVVRKLKVIGTTKPTPGLPLITARNRDTAPIANAIHAAIDDLAPRDRAALHIKGLIGIPAAAYLAVPNPRAP
ncbi:phosphate/phosphite/phosphonate ABC transporter substrate-binding protein [Sedimentitalea sp. XS_ASV28]|uniref:phosphate/phosphite/phosphonate ABC transporter substrate-binding protein n=1 Tax=Sedimentitalea sp. XS_ASV28 TaxID=3241296 RepID=UPI0035115F7A